MRHTHTSAGSHEHEGMLSVATCIFDFLAVEIKLQTKSIAMHTWTGAPADWCDLPGEPAEQQCVLSVLLPIVKLKPCPETWPPSAAE